MSRNGARRRARTAMGLAAALASTLVLNGEAGAQTDGDLRLADETATTTTVVIDIGDADTVTGILEIFHSEEWRSVCDDHWDDVDAGVACAQLGFSNGTARRGLDFPGNEPTAYWLDDVFCDGSETSLLGCANPGLGLHNCKKAERAGVTCSNMAPPTPPQPPPDPPQPPDPPPLPPEPDEPSTGMDLTLSTDTVREGAGASPLTVTATMNGASEQSDTTVSLALQDGTAKVGVHFAAVAPVTLTIPANSRVGTARLTLTPADDDIDGEDRTLTLVATLTTTGSSLTLDPSSFSLTIADDDERGLDLPREPVRIDEEGVATWTVALRSEPDPERGDPTVTVGLDPERMRLPLPEGVALDPDPPQLTFTAGAWNTVQTMTLTVDPPDRFEGTNRKLPIHYLASSATDYEGVTGTVELVLGRGPVREGPRSGWMMRFGRTVAEQVVDAVAGRLEGPPSVGVEVRLAGLTPEAPDGEFAMGRRGMTGRPPVSRAVTERELLAGTSLSATGGTSEDGGLRSLWGRGAIARFDGRIGAVSLGGEVGSAMLGADWTRGPLAAGLMVAHSRGTGDYRGEDPGAPRAEVESTLTGLFPYGRYGLNERITVWGVAGYGTGELTVTPEDGTPTETGMNLRMAAIGLRGVAMEASSAGAPELAVRSDAIIVRTRSEADPRGGETGFHRLGLVVEGRRSFETGAGGTLASTLEAGVRHDGGDAETGAGVEAGAGVRYAHPGSGLSVEAAGRGLLAHEEADYAEWGLSGSLRFDPGAGRRGLSLTLTSRWEGAASGGGAAPRQLLGGVREVATNEAFEPAGRLDAEAGYGLGAFGGRGRMTPYVGLGRSQPGERSWRTGLRWTLEPYVALDLEGAHREPANDDAAMNALVLRAAMRW